MDTVLNWVTSFVTGSSQQVVCNGLLSTIQYLQFGVLQGSVLNPILFVMYTAELSHVVAQPQFHQYADDCQIYVSTLVNAVHSAIDRFSCSLEDVEAWMTANRLHLNASKTQVMSLGSRHNLDIVTVSEVQVLTSTVRVARHATSALSLTAG